MKNRTHQPLAGRPVRIRSAERRAGKASQLEARIVAITHEKPHWGARKIRELLVRRLPSDVIHAVLYRHGSSPRLAVHAAVPPGRRYRAE